MDEQPLSAIHEGRSKSGYVLSGLAASDGSSYCRPSLIVASEMRQAFRVGSIADRAQRPSWLRGLKRRLEQAGAKPDDRGGPPQCAGLHDRTSPRHARRCAVLALPATCHPRPMFDLERAGLQLLDRIENLSRSTAATSSTLRVRRSRSARTIDTVGQGGHRRALFLPNRLNFRTSTGGVLTSSDRAR